MNDHKAFFGTGYKKKEEKPLNQTQGYMKVIKGTLTDDDIPIEDNYTEQNEMNLPVEIFPVSVNIMGKIYGGQEKIEIFGGDIIIDGIRINEKMPNTSGTWFKVLKGKKIQNSILTIVRSCDIMEGEN